MTHDQAKTIRERQLSGIAVAPDELAQALGVLNQPGQQTARTAGRPKVARVIRPRAGRKAYPAVMNPWALTGAQAMTMNLRVEGKDIAEIALIMDCAHKTVSTRIDAAKINIGASSALMAALMWDRFARGAA